MKKKPFYPLFFTVLTIGLLCSSVLTVQRIQTEQSDTYVAAGMLWSDVVLLSEESGEEPGTWLSLLGDADMEYILLTSEDAADSTITAQWTAAGLEPVYVGSMEDFSGTASLLIPTEPLPENGNGQAIALVENNDRTGVLLPDETWGAADLRENGYQAVKTLKLYDDYRNRYTEKRSGEEIEALLFRAVTDRSQRFLWLTPFTDESGTLVTDSAVYTNVLTTLSARLTDRGYTFGEGFSARTPSVPQPLLTVGAALTVAALAALLIKLLFPAVSETLSLLILLAAAVGCIGVGIVLPPALFETLASLGAAVVVPSLMILLLARTVGKEQDAPLILQFPVALAVLIFGSLLGGLLVAALLSNESYLLEFSTFSGVKAAEFTPMVLAAALLFFAVKKFSTARPQKVSMNSKILVVLGVLFVAAVLVLLLLRSGDGMLSVPYWEQMARDFLERTLYARPRTKEFLGAWPALAVFLWAGQKKLPLLQLPFGLLAAVGSVSVVNTFCHLYTPLHVSVIRTLLGLLLGLVVGYLALLVLHFLEKIAKA